MRNYRIMKTRLDYTGTKLEGAEEPHWIYGLHEVYYKENGRIDSRTEDSIIGYFDSVDELVNEIKLMYKDAMKTKDVILDHDKSNKYNNNYKKQQLNVLHK